MCWFCLQEAQQSSLLDMEMADYERLVKELNAKLQGQDEFAEELKAQINTLTQKEDTLKQEIGTHFFWQCIMRMSCIMRNIICRFNSCTEYKDHLSEYTLGIIIISLFFFGISPNHCNLSVCVCLWVYMYVCLCAFVSTEALKSQLDQGEEKTSKMKQLLVKTKKDLADAKKQVCSVCVCMCVCICVPQDFLSLSITGLPDECK